jgi:hypothetical protein
VKVVVRVNDMVGPYFESKKALKQGDPMVDAHTYVHILTLINTRTHTLPI